MNYYFSVVISYLLALSVVAQTPTRNQNIVVLDAVGVKNLGIESVAVEESTFERTVSVLGEIEHTCASHSVLSSRVSGKIVEVRAHKGEFVKKGDVLLRMESRQPGDPPPIIDLLAPADGLVTESEGHLGAPVAPDQPLMEILDLTTVWVVARVPQHQATLLKDGLSATVNIFASSEKEHASTFLRLGTSEQKIPGTVDAIFPLSNPQMALRPGMRAEVSLITSRRENVLSLPRLALQGDRSNRFVFIKDYELEHTFVRVPVGVGEITDERVEIISGLFPGDEVVVKGAYALSFAGKGSASLKEALDAAHGHPHNEDGTEMSEEDIAASEHGPNQDHKHSNENAMVFYLSITCAVLVFLLIVMSITRKPKKQEGV